MKRVLRRIAILMLLVLGISISQADAQSRVSGQLFSQFSLQLINPSVLGTTTFPLNLNLNSIFSYGTNGQGAGNANQLYASQLSVGNGSNVFLNLRTFSGINDPVGNPYTNAQIKFIAFQNLGVSNAPSETNVCWIVGTNSSASWTNLFASQTGTNGIILPGPYSTPSANNAPPSAMFFAPGDVGWSVGSASDNVLVFTNPVPSSTVLVNVYVIGSSGL